MRWNRRRFIATAGLALGSGYAGWRVTGSWQLFAQAPATSFPDEILNPVEVSGPEAEPVIGRLTGPRELFWPVVLAFPLAPVSLVRPIQATCTRW